jgi:hypothetical protein
MEDRSGKKGRDEVLDSKKTLFSECASRGIWKWKDVRRMLL